MIHDPSQPPLISETLLKNRRSLEELSYRRSVTVAVQNQKKRNVKGEVVKIKRPEQFVREFRIREGSNHKMLRRQKMIEKRSSSSIAKMLPASTVGLVVRIHGGKHAAAEIKTALKKMDLKSKYDACFVKLDEEAIRKLKPLDAYVAYGFISRRSVESLIHRRAHTTDTLPGTGGKKQPLADNILIEKLLGEQGIICIADLVEEIFNVGPNFKAATGILSTFKLASPIGNFEEKILKAHDKVEEKGGFIAMEMDDFLNKIL